MPDAPAFDFYAERWSHGTRHMTKVQRSDYLDLLIFQWTEGALPAAQVGIARILGYRQFNQIPRVVIAKFPIGPDGLRRNLRLEEIRIAQRQRIQSSRARADKMNERRREARAQLPPTPKQQDTAAAPPAASRKRKARPPSTTPAESPVRQASPPQQYTATTSTPPTAVTIAWLREIQPTHPHAQVLAEWERCRTWYQSRKRTATQSSFLRWLARIPSPVTHPQLPIPPPSPLPGKATLITSWGSAYCRNPAPPPPLPDEEPPLTTTEGDSSSRNRSNATPMPSTTRRTARAA